MSFDYRSDQLLARDTVRDFARTRIAPHADEWNDAGAFPTTLVGELASIGLTGITVPEELGGAGLDMLTSALIMEEVAAADGSIALTLAAHNSLAIGHLLVAGSAEQKARLVPPLARGEHLGAWALTEPGSGSDAVSATTRARRDGDVWVLDGTKQFITNGSRAGLTVVMAATEPRRLTAFAVPRGSVGLRAARRERKMGLHASDTAQLVLEGCRVDDRDLVGVAGEAFGDVKQVLDRGRVGIGAIAVGLGRGALEIAIAYAKERTQFGKPIADFQMVQLRLVRAATQLDAARLLVHRAASRADRGETFTREASMAKLYASEAGTRAANDALQVLGGYGYIAEYGVERRARDARLMEIGEGTSEIQRVIIARDLLQSA